MSVWGALSGGLAGTLLLTTMLRAATELGLTRMDLPFLLGTALTEDRRRAKLAGYVLHFVFGLIFAATYFAVFRSIGRSGWAIGAIFGLGHGVFSASALVNTLLPVVHPRMGDEFTASDQAPLLEAPGFLLHNYGRATLVVTLLGHVAYGAIVGGLIALS